jgi:hypothetical protein
MDGVCSPLLVLLLLVPTAWLAGCADGHCGVQDLKQALSLLLLLLLLQLNFPVEQYRMVVSLN